MVVQCPACTANSMKVQVLPESIPGLSLYSATCLSCGLSLKTGYTEIEFLNIKALNTQREANSLRPIAKAKWINKNTLSDFLKPKPKSNGTAYKLTNSLGWALTTVLEDTHHRFIFQPGNALPLSQGIAEEYLKEVLDRPDLYKLIPYQIKPIL